jgi:hypothetical protein
MMRVDLVGEINAVGLSSYDYSGPFGNKQLPRTWHHAIIRADLLGNKTGLGIM